MKLMCKFFDHKYKRPIEVIYDQQFGRLTLEICSRCNHRRVEDDEDRADRMSISEV
jgi:Prophage protein (DUF1660)